MVRLIDADAIPFRDELKRLSVLDHDKYITAETLEYMLEHAPTVEAVPVKHGRWIPTHESGMFSHPYSITYVCSECGNKIYTLMGMPQVTEYCSKCGAKMDIIEVTDD